MEQLFNIPKLYTSILLESMHYAKVPAGWSFPNHRHSMFEFIYCASGSMEQWVNGQPYVLRDGDAILIKGGLYHHTAEIGEDTEFFVFHFDIDMKEIRSIFQLISAPLVSSRHEDGPFNASKWVAEFIGEFKDVLLQHRDDAPKGAEDEPIQSVKLLRMQMRILDFICLLAEYFIRQSNVSIDGRISPAQLRLAHEVAFELELQAGDRLQWNELSKKMGFHRSYLSNCFKQAYGISPRAYFTKIKMRSAKQLLQNTDLTIEEIAGRLEFSSPAHFSTFFLNNEGVSPLKYRNRQRK